MSESGDVVAERLAAAFDEADATLDWVEAASGPAIVRLARLRPALTTAGIGCLAVAAMTVAAGGDPSEQADVSRVCREATELLDDAVGPLAGRWRIDGVADRLTPVGLGIGDDPLDAAVTDQAMVRIGSIILRTVDVLFAIAEEESVMPDLRKTAAEALDVFDELEGETILTILADLQDS
ncbi:hypothetical protein ACFV9C_41695 [Kribbella sp. NPDC059898]|uniref:hypothetical protein n=1 Tax=Kribbella sp. NPDC059898 TaxID=3346995 RepID=UPI00364D966D